MAQPQHIIQAIEEHYNLSIEDIRTHTRKYEILIARQTLQYLLVRYGDCSQRCAGELTGGYSKSTIKKSIRSVLNLKDTNKAYRKEITLLILKIQDIDLSEFCNNVIQNTTNEDIIYQAQQIIKTL